MLAARALRISTLSKTRVLTAFSGCNSNVNAGIAPIQLLGRTFFSGPSKGEDKSTEETANNEDSGIPSSPNWKSRLLSILENNKVFTESDEWKKDISKSTPPPPKEKKPRAIIITCMDTRLTKLIPAAMNLKQEEAKVIRTAGGIISHNFGGIMRSILIALYELNGDEVYIVGHDDCGMQSNSPTSLLQKIKKRTDVTDETLQTLEIAGVNIKKWLQGFENVEESVLNSVQLVRNHPLVPNDVPIHGFVIDPHTAKMRLIVDGNEFIEEQKALRALKAKAKKEKVTDVE